jgi:hypothetical protein
VNGFRTSLLCRVSTMIIMTELDSSTFFHAVSQVVHESGPREWSTRVVHESGPREWSTRVVHKSGPREWSMDQVHEGSPRTWGPRFVISHNRKQFCQGLWSNRKHIWRSSCSNKLLSGVWTTSWKIQKLFLRLCIYYSLKFANRDFSNTKKKNRKYLKVAHL